MGAAGPPPLALAAGGLRPRGPAGGDGRARLGDDLAKDEDEGDGEQHRHVGGDLPVPRRPGAARARATARGLCVRREGRGMGAAPLRGWDGEDRRRYVRRGGRGGGAQEFDAQQRVW